MSIYQLDGTELSAAYDVQGNSLSSAFDIEGIEVLSGDYDRYSNEYQHTILLARDAWKAEYRADNTIVPLVLATDQHGTLSKTFAKSLFSYLSLAVKWGECSACLNLGDVANYSVSAFNEMKTCLAPIPANKQINIWGNHETWTEEWGSDTSVPTADDWETLQEYYDNSAYNGYVFMPGTKCSQYMIDAVHGIKYVVIGGWDYDKSIGGHSHYVIDGTNMESIISMLSVVDDYDVVILSHVQPYSGRLGGQIQNDGTTTWYKPEVDGRSSIGTTTATYDAIVHVLDTQLNQLLDDRKNKRSGTVKDSYGVNHSYDFTSCTSDLICSLHGHSHTDAYDYHPLEEYTMPVVIFDAIHYDNHPFFFINIDRTRERLNIWKVDDTPTFYNYQIPFELADQSE